MSRHGHNVFFRQGDRVFRTYWINNRGDEAMGSNVEAYLDATPLGRFRSCGRTAAPRLSADPDVQVVELAQQL